MIILLMEVKNDNRTLCSNIINNLGNNTLNLWNNVLVVGYIKRSNDYMWDNDYKKSDLE